MVDATDRRGGRAGAEAGAGPELAKVLDAGRRAGFAAVGVASCEPSEHAARLDVWLARGAHAGMSWMAETAEVRKDLRRKWSWARTALVGAAPYLSAPRERQEAPGLGRHLARYARGRDYHDVVKAQLIEWGTALPGLVGRAVKSAALVDTSAVLERELAVRAGIGWIGKNTCLIGADGDSWRFIGVLLTDLDLPPAAARLAERCGPCRACLDACPTGALVEPWVLDSNRCISYWTIEHRGAIPPEIQPALGDWLFGCDVCQEVCPHNRRVAPRAAPAFETSPRYAEMTLAQLLRSSEQDVREIFRGAPLARSRRAGLLRNAMIVARNTGDAEALAAARALTDDDDPTVRATARQILGE